MGIGSGKLLSPESYKAMVTPDHGYGLGIVVSGKWLLQHTTFAGESAVEGYLPSQKIAIAVAVTYDSNAFDDQGNYRNEADGLFRKIGAELAPTTPRRSANSALVVLRYFQGGPVTGREQHRPLAGLAAHLQDAVVDFPLGVVVVVGLLTVAVGEFERHGRRVPQWRPR